jgi:thiamine-monophosphate kinase
LPLPERQLIERLRKAARAGARGPCQLRGIGDDCAVLRPPPGHDLLVTTDFTLEGVHFRREWHPADSVGHRCLARGLSDIAAMGGEPIAAFLSLALPKNLPQRWADDFIRGLLKLAGKFGIPLAGGDTAASPHGVLADIVVLGSAPKKRAVLRSGARGGDRIYVTGELGAASAVLERLFAGKKLRARDYPRHFYPVPRIEVGRALREKSLASAMIDLSDGLSTDLTHLCEESGGWGAVLDEAALPLATVGGHEVDLRFALHGGDDYELLFTARPGKKVPPRIAGVEVTQIGEIRARVEATAYYKTGKLGPQYLYLRNRSGKLRRIQPQGWEYFRA